MTTTTLRVPPELKERVAQLAERAGKSVHAFMLEAIEERVRMEEARSALMTEAQDRFQDLMNSGQGIDWHEMRAHLKERAAGRKSRAPRARRSASRRSSLPSMCSRRVRRSAGLSKAACASS
ncbi:MAG: ribbon-helix-helix protein, CopG family [Myxococcaceae bacterium]